MRVVTASNGAKNLVLSQTEWETIGRRNGWLRTAADLPTSVPVEATPQESFTPEGTRLLAPKDIDVAAMADQFAFKLKQLRETPPLNGQQALVHLWRNMGPNIKAHVRPALADALESEGDSKRSELLSLLDTALYHMEMGVKDKSFRSLKQGADMLEDALRRARPAIRKFQNIRSRKTPPPTI